MTTTLIGIGIAVGVGLLIYGFVYAGGSRGSKRYRPGRPFAFTPVWFLSAPHQQARSGISANRTPVRAEPEAVTHPRDTGGASDRW